MSNDTESTGSHGRPVDNRVPKSRESNAAWIGVIASLTGVVIGTATQYFVTFLGVEKPKLEMEQRRIELENRRSSLEGHKLALSLTPNVNTGCISTIVDKWTWRIFCTSKNAGVYHVDISIEDVRLSALQDTKETLNLPGSDFTIRFPNDKKSFRAAPGFEGDLWFYVDFDKKVYPNGRAAEDLEARIAFRYATLDSVQRYLTQQFPELKALVLDSAVRATRIGVPASSTR